ncbi:hypothetical protein HMPREF1219_01188 [Corynebacterium pyruviciproducens ATCC BAA-1742]|uniref:Uncharacterized protein n=1 Tax=Corynebacterium pyruviciproducens ATCC BAA-1742 TaxID=1125779 RepID=S2Z520_9CORY|nr:hypothetical protein [Corynebacterium pyruviciproducens]EPD69320.1 hypothetical protein HMPREF1219_01188 [Corynebacterium pyruviciproducens ATCC BAA-1742]
MATYLPESEAFDLRSYLFVDRQRVGSLLAQFSDGLPVEKTHKEARSNKVRAGIKNFFEGEKNTQAEESQVLAVADLHVSQLEENAEALGYLADISETTRRRRDWLRGKVRKQIKPGMLLRITAPTQITDISSIIESTLVLNKAIDQDPDQSFQSLLELMGAMYGKSISVSVRPAEGTDSECCFVGEIPYDFEFGPMRRELLLSQIGASPIEATTLMQVAAVPTERDENPIERSMNSIQELAQKITTGATINRRYLDELMSRLGLILGDAGFKSAPAWPAISVIPLAIYRYTPSTEKLKNFLEEELED